jgi:hypothetical protein
MIAATRATTRLAPRTSARDAIPPADAPAIGTAIVLVAPVSKPDETPRLMQRPTAPFLAQLIATDRKLPQTRGRNRAEPGDAMAAYADAARMLHRGAH